MKKAQEMDFNQLYQKSLKSQKLVIANGKDVRVSKKDGSSIKLGQTFSSKHHLRKCVNVKEFNTLKTQLPKDLKIKEDGKTSERCIVPHYHKDDNSQPYYYSINCITIEEEKKINQILKSSK